MGIEAVILLLRPPADCAFGHLIVPHTGCCSDVYRQVSDCARVEKVVEFRCFTLRVFLDFC